MPIDYKQYHPKWKLISYFIRHYRARNKCEWCGAPNHTVIRRERVGPHWSIPDGGHYEEVLVEAGIIRYTKVVLTVAHIDHTKSNNSFFNLAALCQRCHLNHDRKQHQQNRLYRRMWEAGQQQLF